jgi:hypothetical protein
VAGLNNQELQAQIELKKVCGVKQIFIINKKKIKNIANQAKKEIVFINIYIKLFYQITQTHTLLSLSLLSRNVTF